MTALRIIHNFSAPCLNHTCQYVRKFCLTYALVREYLGIMAADVLNNLQGLTGKPVDKTVFHLLSQFMTEMIYHVRRVSYILGYVELAFAGLVEVLTSLFQKFGMLLPHVDHLCENAERRNAGRNVVLIAAFGH